MKVTVLVGEMLCTSSSLTQPGFSPFSSAMKYADTNPGCSDYKGTRYCKDINFLFKGIVASFLVYDNFNMVSLIL